VKLYIGVHKLNRIQMEIADLCVNFVRKLIVNLNHRWIYKVIALKVLIDI